MAAHHDIFLDGRTARCLVCLQAWGDCNAHDVRNLRTVMVCPEEPVRARACPEAPGANTCWAAECYDTCAAATPAEEPIKSLCSACEAAGSGWRVARSPFDSDRCVYGHILRSEGT